MKKNAFTFVEVMMSVVIFTMIMGALYAGLIAANRSWATYEAESTAQREARRAFVTLSRDLRMARHVSITDPDHFSFHHPDDGRVRYTRSPAGDLTRSTESRTWVVARHISRLLVDDNQATIGFGITSQGIKKGGQPEEFSLESRVVKRR